MDSTLNSGMMSAPLRLLAIVPLVAASAGAWQTPQTPQSPPDPLPTLRITVTLVQVDAVVTDSSGRHIPDLHADDFELLQDGQPQKITHFSYIPGPQPAPPAPPKPDKNAPPVPLAAPAALQPDQVHRTVALVVDDMALSFENMVRTRDALHKYIDTVMQPGDLVALVRTGGGVAILEQFTSDKRILSESVDLLKWKFFGRAGVMPISPAGGPPDSGPQAGPEALDYGYQLAALGALATLDQVIEGMKRMPGRKSIVFISDSLRVNPQIIDAVDQITDLANRSAVSLYTVDPGGLRAAPAISRQNRQVYVPDATTRRFPGLGTPEPDDDFGSQEGLSYLAARTGGIFYHNTNDIPGAIRSAIDDQLGYYLLGYSPAEGTFSANPRASQFHKVTVRVKRAGLQVRWKSGFQGVPDDALPATEVLTAKSREQELAEALASPFAAADIHVRLTCLFLDQKDSGPVVYSMLHFDGKDLSFTQAPDGGWNALVDVITLAYRGLREPLRQTQQVRPIHLSDELYRRALTEGFVLNYATPVKEPGAFIIRAVVRDHATQRIGSASQVIQVPDVRKGQFALSGITLKQATPDILEKMGYTVASNTPHIEEWHQGGPSLRRFLGGQQVAFGYTVLNPKLHHTPRKAELIVQSFVYRNGKLIHSSTPSSNLLPLPDDPTRFYGGGLLNLGADLTPGEYILQVVVTDKLAPKKKNRASQWMDFEVLGPSAPAAAAVSSHGRE